VLLVQAGNHLRVDRLHGSAPVPSYGLSNWTVAAIARSRRPEHGLYGRVPCRLGIVKDEEAFPDVFLQRTAAELGPSCLERIMF
jgi:hypothetical protein